MLRKNRKMKLFKVMNSNKLKCTKHFQYHLNFPSSLFRLPLSPNVNFQIRLINSKRMQIPFSGDSCDSCGSSLFSKFGQLLKSHRQQHSSLKFKFPGTFFFVASRDLQFFGRYLSSSPKKPPPSSNPEKNQTEYYPLGDLKQDGKVGESPSSTKQATQRLESIITPKDSKVIEEKTEAAKKMIQMREEYESSYIKYGVQGFVRNKKFEEMQENDTKTLKEIESRDPVFAAV